MHPDRFKHPADPDTELERQIDEAHRELCEATSPIDARRSLNKMQALMNKRRPSKIAEMEASRMNNIKRGG